MPTATRKRAKAPLATTQLLTPSEPLLSILRHLDPQAVSDAAKSESRNREVHLPPVSVYRWWARRTEAVNGALIDAFSLDHHGPLVVADIFAGGGVIPLAAVTRGHKVYAQDLNPWAAVGLAAMLGLPNASALREAAASLRQWVETEISAAYGTVLSDGSAGLVSHTFRVATAECTKCSHRARLFPHALVSLLVRRERKQPDAFLACPNGHLFKGDSTYKKKCPECRTVTDPDANYTPRREVVCRSCGHADRLEDRGSTWQWEVVLVERSRRGTRELSLPSQGELDAAADARWEPKRTLGAIPDGQETRVLTRHGFKHWEDLYPKRQRALLERLLVAADHCSPDPAVTWAIKIAIIGSAEMAGHLSRWDRYYLKSYESMAGHRFNLTTLSVEPNVWGTSNSGRGTVLRRVAQLVKAAEWLHAKTSRELVVDGPVLVPGSSGGKKPLTEDVRIAEGSSETILLPSESVHLVLTDPPYHDDVQYSELSLPFRAWADLADGHLLGEAVVNSAMKQLTQPGEYEDLLTRIFAEARRTLRVDGHLIFSYANRSPAAWSDLFSALQRAGLRAAGCEIVHSENETDSAKRGVRACTLDLILDLVPCGDSEVVQHAPASIDETDESTFLQVVASTFLQVGSLPAQWKKQFHGELSATPFIKGAARRAADT